MFGLAKKLVSTFETQASTYLGSQDDTFGGVGMRVLGVEKGSLGEKYGFESWFDFVTAINGRDVASFFQQGKALDSNPYSGAIPGQVATNNYGVDIDPANVNYSTLLEFLKVEVDQRRNDLEFAVWSAKGGVVRAVTIPYLEFNDQAQLDEISIKDSGDSDSQTVRNTAFRQMKVTFQLTPIVAASYVWHIIRVQRNSPAYVAGIIPDEYVLNCEGGKLSTGGEDLLGRVVQTTYNKWASQYQQQMNNPYGSQVEQDTVPPCSLVLYVYNHDYDTVRPVTIYPNNKWGGPGLLGCDIGYGLLHRIPEVIKGGQQAGLAPGDVMFSQQPQFSQESLPAATDNLLQPSVRAPAFTGSQVHLITSDEAANPPPVRKTKHANKYTASLDDYFKEEQAKSEEIDGPSKASGADVPPPPKPKGAAPPPAVN